MKEIFDWLKEQIDDHLNHCKQMVGQSRYFSEGIGYCSRVVAYEIALELINEAEAKWEADCCEWEHKRYHANCLCKCNGNHFFLDYDLVSSFRVCPYCRKPIKISEVE